MIIGPDKPIPPKWEGPPPEVAETVNWDRPWESGHVKLDTVTPSPKNNKDWVLPLAGRPAPTSLPAVTATSVFWPAGWQGSKGSCMTHAALAQLRHALHLTGIAVDPSEGFSYALALEHYNRLCNNDGAYPRDVYDLLKSTGTLTEEEWPYVTDESDLCRAPTVDEKAAARFKIDAYYAAQGLDGLRTALNGDMLVLICMVLFNNWTPDPTNNFVIPPPDPASGSPGAHAICAEMVDMNFDCGRYGTGAIRVLNWWSKNWGNDGRAWLPLSFMTTAPENGGIWQDELRTILLPANTNVTPAPRPTRTVKGRVRQWTPNPGKPWTIKVVGEVDLPVGAHYDLEVQNTDGRKWQANPYAWAE